MNDARTNPSTTRRVGGTRFDFIVAILTAVLFAALALSTENRLMRAVRIVVLVGFVSVTTAFVALSVVYGFDVEYRFEVAAITIDWTVLIVAGALLAIAYRRRSEAASA